MPPSNSPGYPPGYEIGYDQITSNVNVVSTTESSGTTIISAAAHLFDGGPVVAEFFGFLLPANVAAVEDFLAVSLFEGATQISRLAILDLFAASLIEAAIGGRYRFTPTAGLHTYTVTAFVNSTSGTPKVIAGSGGTAGNPPAFIRFTKV